MDVTLQWIDDERIISMLDKHIRVNTTNKTVEIYNEYGVALVLRDLPEENYNAFKARFTNF